MTTAGVHTIYARIIDRDGGHSDYTATVNVNYLSGGFLSPVSLNRAFKQGSTIPIKWQLNDASGHLINSLGAITSLTVSGPTSATLYPGNNSSSGATVLRNDGSQYLFNWQTKGFGLGQYTITATLNDGSHTVVSSMIQLSTPAAARAW